MNKPIVLGVAALLALAGCSSEPASNVVIANEASPVADVPATRPVTNTTAAKEIATPALNLAPDELTLVLPSGSARHMTFGMEKAAALKAVGAVLGTPIEQGTNPECGAGTLDFATFRDGMSLYFQDGKFAGWDLDGRENPKFSTANGIGIGSTRAELEAAGQVNVVPSTIGIEFQAGDISGLLSTANASGKVTNLWAGVNCIAR